MFPHQNNIRERRVGQPPMAPQHLMGMPQQGPGVIMPMPAQQVQIMTQNHYPNQNTYSAQGQSSVSQYVTPQQVPPQKSNYHQSGYSHNNPQVILTKQAINRNKTYRKDYSVVKDPVNYSINDQNNQNNFRNNESNSFSGYHQGNFNGHYQAQDSIQKSSVSHETPTVSKENEEAGAKNSIAKNSENKPESSTISQNIVTGTKEKTPMCLVNELARFNKITHQYRLTNEKGPAHKKRFTVTLTLGTEEYTAEGPSIKKAQHSAAAEALTKTAYSHPLPKANKNIHSGKSNITPTVELNALAMKRGEPAIYKFLEPTPAPHIFQPQSSFAFRRPYGIHRGFNKRGRNNTFSRGGRIPMKTPYAQNMHYTVSLKVESWEFFGEGMSPQAARHDAASKALAQLKMLPVPEENTCSVQKDNSLNPNQDYDSTLKSPISLVHEIALKRNMNVSFEVISDRGPSHMKIFVTKCTVGELTATGEGNGKKVSKKRAAENMLIELKKLPPLSPSFAMGSMSLSRMKRKFTQTKKKSRNLIKIVQENKKEPEYGEEINPISRLIQLQQLKKEKEPVYTLLEEKGTPRKREFLMEVSIGQLKATGSGPNKKLAKKAAAQNLLTQMGYTKPENPTKSALKMQEGSQDSVKERKVTFVDAEKSSENNNTGGSAGRQLKPGIYVMSCDQHISSSNNHSTSVNMQTTATIAKELLKGGNSPTADALLQKSTVTKSTIPLTGAHSFRPKDQLLYLADLLNFQVHFSDFPKGNHSEFLSLVTMSTDPSHVCHGSGPSIEESQDQAALTALRALSEMGLDSVTTQNSTKDPKQRDRAVQILCRENPAHFELCGRRCVTDGRSRALRFTDVEHWKKGTVKEMPKFQDH